MDNVIKHIVKNDMFLYVIGPAIDPPKIICSKKDLVDWMSTLEVDKSNSNLKIMKKIINQTPHSVMCNYHVGVHLFHAYVYNKGKSFRKLSVMSEIKLFLDGQPWQVPLSFGTQLNIPASTVPLSRTEPPFKLKNEGRSSKDEKWYVLGIEVLSFHFQSVFFRCYEDQPDVVIDPCDTVSGLVKHGKFIKIENESSFKIVGPRSFNVLGFTKATNVPEVSSIKTYSPT